MDEATTKDTLKNIQDTGVFALNIVSESFGYYPITDRFEIERKIKPEQH